MDIETFCKKAPKIELHAHLGGSLSTESLLKLGGLKANIEEYQKLSSMLSRDRTTQSLEECFKLFSIAQRLLDNKEAVYLATKYVIQEFADENVIYLELRTTPRNEVGMTKSQYIEAVVNGIKDSKILTKLLLSIDRRHSPSVSNENMNLYIRAAEQYPDIIKGIDLSGDPLHGYFDSDLFKLAVDKGLFVTIHGAEIKNDEEVKRILTFRPHRIGHATCLHPNYRGSNELWELYRENPIPIECCLTSNVMCGTSQSYHNHHLKEWIKSKLPFTISTDDKGVFNTTLSKEMENVARNLEVNFSDLLEVTQKSIDYSFASKEEKESLKKLVAEWKIQNNFQM